MSFINLTYHPLDQFEIIPLCTQTVTSLPVGPTIITNLTIMLLLNVCIFRIIFGYIFDKDSFNTYELVLRQIYGLIKNIISANTNLKRHQYFAIIFFLFSFILIANLVGL